MPDGKLTGARPTANGITAMARNAATPCNETAGQAAALGCDERRWRACPAPRITVVLLYSEDIHIRYLVANTLFWRLFV